MKSTPLRVLTVGPAPAGPNSRGGIASVIRVMLSDIDQPIRVRSIPTYLDGGIATRLRVGITGMLRASAIILAGRTDVVHVHLSQGGSVARKALPLLAARVRGIPSVVHAHGSRFTGWFDRLPRPAQRLVRAALPADLWLVLGEAMRDRYARRLHLRDDQIRVLLNPVQIPAEPPERQPGNTVLAVFLGRLGERKGCYDLIRALKMMPSRRGLRVIAAGDGEVEQVRAAAGDALEVRSWLSPAARDELLAEAEIFVLPSHDEAMPMALLEAMAWGLAPVTTPVGGIPDVVVDDENGVLVPAGDPPALAAALTELATDADRRARIGAEARRTAAKFDADAWSSELANIWEELVKENSRSHATGRRPDPR